MYCAIVLITLLHSRQVYTECNIFTEVLIYANLQHCVQMFSQISHIPDLIQKFWAKRCGLYAGVYSKWSLPKYRAKRKPKNLDNLSLFNCKYNVSSIISQFPNIFVAKVDILQLENIALPTETQSIGIHEEHLFNTEIAKHYRAIFIYIVWLILAVLWAERNFVGMFWPIFLMITAKQDQSGCCFQFDLLCEWFYDWFHWWETSSQKVC